MNKLIKILTSLRLTVVLLCFGIALVFIGTIAQVDEGLYQAQNRYFRSLLIWWSPEGSHLKIPIFPGGYLVGGLLLANLIAAHIARFKFTKSKIGILVTHFGLILLLLGQFGTDLFSRETLMKVVEGESSNYSEAARQTELALIDTSDANSNRVYAISESLLAKKGTIQSEKLPVTVRVKNFWQNATLSPVPPIASNIPPSMVLPKDLGITGGDTALQEAGVIPQAPVTNPDLRNVSTAVVELLDGSKSLGTFLVSLQYDRPQEFELNGKSYEVSLRAARDYYPFSITLLKATHDKYKGTDIPKNFASRIRVEYPEKHEARETVIYMNNPLRYEGLTFFQSGMDADEMTQEAGRPPSSVFQVVHNPSWLTPYLACILVGLGLVIQFMTHLFKFAMKRREPAPAKTTAKAPKKQGDAPIGNKETVSA